MLISQLAKPENRPSFVFLTKFFEDFDYEKKVSVSDPEDVEKDDYVSMETVATINDNLQPATAVTISEVVDGLDEPSDY